MFKKALQYYTFAACLICAALVLISVDKSIRTLPQLSITEMRYSDYLENFEDDESYREYQESINPSFTMQNEELTNLRIAERDKFIDDKKNQAWEIISKELERGLIMFAILIFHWYINKRVSFHINRYSNN